MSVSNSSEISYRRLFLTALIVLGLDQLTKVWIIQKIPFGTYSTVDSIEIIPDFFYLVHIGNKGAAWGMFAGYSLALAIFALIALVAIYLFRDTLELQKKPMQYSFGLITGGVIGNLIDRLLHQHVIDFLDFHLPFSIPKILEGGRYPSFNIADSGIVVGVFIYIFLTWWADLSTKKEKAL